MGRTPKKDAARGRSERRYGDGRVAFLARFEALQRWVAEGRTLKSFYDSVAGDLGITYSQFVRHARGYGLRVRRPVPSVLPAVSVDTVPANALSESPQPGDHGASRPGVGQFVHSPVGDDLDLV